MRYLMFSLLIFSLLIGCKDDETNNVAPENIEIMLVDELEYIDWDYESDIIEIARNLVIKQNNSIPQNVLKIDLNYNSDTTEVLIDVSIKEEFSNSYTEIDLSDNSLAIPLYRTALIFSNNINNQICSNFSVPDSHYRAIENTLCENLPTYNFSDSEIIKFPIKIHVLNGASVTESEIWESFNNLNENFQYSKIQFVPNTEINYFNSNLQKNTIDSEYYSIYPYSETELNLYIADFLTCGMQGRASPPSHNLPNRNRIFVRSKYFDSSKDSRSFVLSHEMGHCFSLYHTFAQIESAYQDNPCNNTLVESCFSKNDGICETELHIPFAWTNPIACDGIISSKSAQNFMSYSFKNPLLRNCEREFVHEQNKRMRFAAQEWYGDIAIEKKFSDFESIDDVFETSNKIFSAEVSEDGKNLYYNDVENYNDRKIVQYELVEPFEFTNLNFVGEKNVTRFWKSTSISNDGSKMYSLNEYGNRGYVQEYRLTTPFDINTWILDSYKYYTYDTQNYADLVSDSENYIISDCDYFFNPSLRLRKLDVSDSNISESEQTQLVYTNPICFNSFAFSKDGYDVYAIEHGNSEHKIRKYKLGSPFDLNTLNQNPVDEMEVRANEKIFHLGTEEEFFLTLRQENGKSIIAKYY